MDRHGRVAQHRLRPRGGDGHVRGLARAGIDHRIVEVPEMPRHLLVKDLVVADGRLQHRVPVHQPLAPVDQAVAEEAEEGVPDRPAQTASSVKRRRCPIATAAHLLQLAEDAGFVGVLPLPDAVHQAVAAQLVPAQFFFGQQAALDHGLGGDAGMVGARQPKRLESLHPLPADEDVLERVVQGVAQVQGPGHVRRRNDDGIGLLGRVGLAVKVALLFPEAIPALLGGGVIVLFGEVGKRSGHVVVFRKKTPGGLTGVRFGHVPCGQPCVPRLALLAMGQRDLPGQIDLSETLVGHVDFPGQGLEFRQHVGRGSEWRWTSRRVLGLGKDCGRGRCWRRRSRNPTANALPRTVALGPRS